MLNNLRCLLGPLLERMGRGFAATGRSPNFWTGLGLVLAVAAAAAYGLGPHLGLEQRTLGDLDFIRSFSGYGLLLGGALLLASGFFDVVDGQVARITKRTSRKGSYLDSVSDKIAESAVFVGIAVGGYAEPWLVVMAAALSLLVGYARAKSDALGGISMQGVGIGERAERLLVVAIVGGMIGYMEIALAIVVAISAITLAQRMASTVRQM